MWFTLVSPYCAAGLGLRLSVCQQRAAWLTSVWPYDWICSLGFVLVWHSLICLLHCCIRSISDHIQTLKALIDALRGNVTTAANKLFTNKLHYLMEIFWQARTMFEMSVSIIGHFLKSSQLEMYIGLKRDVANRDKRPHLFFLSWKICRTRQQPPCV